MGWNPFADKSLLALVVAEAVFVLCVVLLSVLLDAVRKARRRRRPKSPTDAELAIDVHSLADSARPAEVPELEFYHVPVKLAAVVIAPAGRGKQVPPAELIPKLVDQISPGLGEIMEHHQPEIRRWPEQLSTSGFTQRFFTLAPLPGDAGKGTPWCSLAGRFDAGGGNFLLGLICRADAANNFGQQAIKKTTGWLDVLRVRR